VRAAAAWLLHRPPLTDASRTWSRLWRERRPLTDLRPVDAVSAGAALAPAPAVAPEVRISGVRRRAVVLETPARLRYHTTAEQPSTLKLWHAVTPSSWADPHATTRIVIRVVAAGAVVAERAVELAPGRLWRDRRWTALSAEVRGPVEVHVEAESASGGVQVAIGDPHIVSRRPWPEVRALGAAFVRRLAHGGVRDTWRWMRLTGRRTTDAERYQAWCAAHTPDSRAIAGMARRAAALPSRPRFSVLVPSYNTPAVLLESCVESVRAQAWPDWELVIADDGSSLEETRMVLRRYESGDARVRVVWNAVNGGIAANTQSALDQATGDFVGLLDADDVLLPHALARVAEAILARPDVDVVYSDEDKLEQDGSRSDPYFKPDWSPDLFLSSMYVCHFLVFRRTVIDAAGGFRSEFDGSQDYDVMLRVMDRTDRIAHVPDVLYHWRKTPASTSSTGAAKPWAYEAGRRALQDYADRNGLDATVVDAGAPGVYRVRYHLRATPPVSVVVPVPEGAGGHAARLAARLGAVRYPDVELILVGSAARDLEEAAGRATRPFRIVEAEGTPGRLLNAGAAAATGVHLLFAEPWVEPLDEHWVDAFVEHIERPGVGIVGGKTFYPDGRLRHIGLVVGAHGLSGRPFDGYAGTWAGYFANADAVRNCRAVSRACLMTPRALFDAVGGADESLVADGLEVDYALRVAERGLRVVWTPFARAAEHVPCIVPPPAPRAEDVARLRARWGRALDTDPYYSPHLVATDPDYHVG
jgi:GT2 family glycosyltransferase